MSRSLRLEFPDALYHVTARGDRREAIFEDDDDRRALLLTLAQVVKRFYWLCYARSRGQVREARVTRSQGPKPGSEARVRSQGHEARVKSS
jgi:REP element-mobilizing transposase RayT